MSYSLGTLTITGGAKTTFEAPIEGVQAVLIGCESGLTCTVTMESGGVQKTLYPGTVDWFAVRKGFTGNILISPVAILNNVATFPASTLIFDAIGLNDSEQASMYPLALPARNTNIGNAVNTVGGLATGIQNDNNGVGTSIVESTVSGDSGSAVSLTNSGHLLLGTINNNGVLEVVGSLGNVTIDSTGKLIVDNRILANLIVAETGNDFAIDVATAHKIALQVNNADVVDISASGLSILSGKVNLLSGAVSRMSIFSGTVNNAGGLINHNLGAVPDIVLFIETNTGTDTNTFTWDPAATTSTQVKAFASGGATPRAFTAIAFKA